MAKRGASSDLNHQNWDHEDEPEDAGSFTKAADDILKKRVIKVAKRRNLVTMGKSEEGGPSVFTGFTFAKTTSSPSNMNSFGFLSNTANKDTRTNGTANTENSEKIDKTGTSDYYAKLKGLNESVLNWISKKVNENPLINLQPVFKDYEKYFDDLEKCRPNDESSSEKAPVEIKSAPTFSFGGNSSSGFNSPTITPVSLSTNIATPAFGTNLENPPPVSTFMDKPSAFPTFNFGKTANKPEATFSFGASMATIKPAEKFSFGSTGTSIDSGKSSFVSTESNKTSFGSNPPAKDSEGSTEDDDDQPPKNNFTPVVEKDHIYTTRCKVFVKKDGNYSDRGVGNLYLKKVPNNEKYQLIVRADTNLGNILCNFILSENIPMQKMGKKDVMLVCLPTPDTKPPPVPILLRVKSPKDAEELLNTLEKYKK